MTMTEFEEKVVNILSAISTGIAIIAGCFLGMSVISILMLTLFV